ncbi:C39 family peptidase [Myxococcota bacterium]|nr:C39 family peptidase [Myxococcota bacterium]
MTVALDLTRTNPQSAIDRLQASLLPRLASPEYQALVDTFGPNLARGYLGAAQRIGGTEEGRGKLAEVLGALGFPADAQDPASLTASIAKLQQGAGLPATGQLDLATLVVMALAAQGQRTAAPAASPNGALFRGPANAPMYGTPAPLGTVRAGELAGPQGREVAPRAATNTPVAPNAPTISAAQRDATNAVGVRPLRQVSSKGCGQTSVAMAINALTGKNVTEGQIARRYGYSLLGALNAESGRAWQDCGNLSTSNLSRFSDLIDRKVNGEKTPVIIGLGGTFTASGYGHIVTIVGYDKASGKVSYADPADGKIKQTTLQYMASQPPHHDGRFVFATR